MRFRHFLLLTGLIYGLTFSYYARWNTNTLYGGDAWGYYAYLPALFIYGDLDDPVTTYQATAEVTGFVPSLPEPGGELHQHPNGNHIIKYTCGVALFELPFFLSGHLLAGTLGIAQNGYTLPYRLSIHLGMLVYLFWGMYLLYRVLLRIVKSNIAIFTLAVIALATNLHYYSVYNGVMAHTVLFFLYSALLYSTVRIYEAPRKKWALLLGLSAGCIILIRPVEIICLALPLLYGVTTRKALHERWQFLGKHWPLVLLTGLVIACCGFPQLLYWKHSTGSFLYYSYADEGFNWLRPNISGGLFSFKNGWLTYTPVMLLSLIGIYFLIRRRSDWLWSVLVFLPLHIYITYSWWCWYYNGFGSRPMVEAYALLAFPLAYFLEVAFRKKWSALAVTIPLLFFSALNLFQTYQTYQGVLLTEAGNRGHYWSVFGKTKLDYGDLVAFDCREQQPDSSSLVLQKVLFTNDFEQATRPKTTQSIAYTGKQAALVEPWDSLGLFQTEIKDLPLSTSRNYLMIEAICYKEILEAPWYEMPYLAVSLKRGDRILRHRTVYIDNKLGNPKHNLWGGQPNVWGWVRMYLHLPGNLSPDDQITVYARGRRQRVYLDDVSVGLYKRRSIY